MKTRYTEGGFALIALVVILVAVSIVGAGIVAFMGAKQKTFPRYVLSYKALMIANAGVEYAIRYTKDNIAALGGLVGLNQSVSFGGGSFTVQYVGGANYTLRSTGSIGGVTRVVELNQFPGFVFGTGLILTQWIDPSRAPSRHSQEITVPMTNLYNRTIYIKFMTLAVPPHGNTDRVEAVTMAGATVYDVGSNVPFNDKSNPNYQKHGSNEGICIPDPSTDTFLCPQPACPGTCPNMVTGRCPSPEMHFAVIPCASNWNLALPAGSTSPILGFKSGSLKGTYSGAFYYDFNTSYGALKSSKVSFTIN